MVIFIALSGCSSPYPLSYTIRWPYYFLKPSTKNHTNISPKPLMHTFKNVSDTDYIKVMVCGDIMVRHGDKVLKFDNNLKELLEEADLIIANCEAPISNEISSNEQRRYYFYFFLMPTEYLHAITKQIENKWILSIANNHIVDNGYDGYEKTKGIVETPGSSELDEISIVGNKDKNSEFPLSIYNVGNVRLGIVAWTQWLNKDKKFPPDQGVYRHYDIFDSNGQELFNWSDIKRKKNVHTIIAYPHWGFEFQHFPTYNYVDQAKKLMESGVDLIVGSHPHVLQAMDWHNGKVCVYSLGNFCGLGGMLWPTKLTAIFEVRISKMPHNCGEVVGYVLHPVVQVDKENKLLLLKDFNSDLKKKLEKRLNIMYY